MSRGRRHQEAAQAAQAARRLAARVGRPGVDRYDAAPSTDRSDGPATTGRYDGADTADDTPPGGWFVPAAERSAAGVGLAARLPDSRWDHGRRPGPGGGSGVADADRDVDPFDDRPYHSRHPDDLDDLDDPDDADGTGAADDDFDWFRPLRRSSGVRGGASSSAAVPGTVERWRGLAADRVPVSLRGAARVPLTGAVAVLLLAVAVVGGVVLRSATADAEVVDVPTRPRSQAVAQVGGSGADAGAGSRSAAAGEGTAAPTPGPSGAGAPGGAAGAGSASGSGAATAPAVPGAGVVVDVVGRVRRPGLVRLPPGSRVADAVAAAGGPTDAAVLRRINLARVLVDGEQVVVPDRDDPLPVAPAAPVAAGGTAGPGATAAGPLDLNAATAADLDGLPGVGPVIAGRIVAWRAEHQRFSSVDELSEVDGIGPRLLERLRPMVRV